MTIREAELRFLGPTLVLLNPGIATSSLLIPTWPWLPKTKHQHIVWFGFYRPSGRGQISGSHAFAFDQKPSVQPQTGFGVLICKFEDMIRSLLRNILLKIYAVLAGLRLSNQNAILSSSHRLTFTVVRAGHWHRNKQPKERRTEPKWIRPATRLISGMVLPLVCIQTSNPKRCEHGKIWMAHVVRVKLNFRFWVFC